MKKALMVVLILLAGITSGLLVNKAFGPGKQSDGIVQICPPDCFPEEKKCG